MADEKHWTSVRLGPFHLGASHDDLGPGPGRLYEAWHTDTGAPVLLLRPGSDVTWQPEGPWRVQLLFDPNWSSVAVKVEEAPAPVDVSDLANLLVMTTAAVTRVEDNPQVRAHLAASRGGYAKSSAPHTVRKSVLLQGMALAGLAMLSLGLGVWLYVEKHPESPPRPTASVDSAIRSPNKAVYFIVSEESGTAAIAYPLPEKPFQNQAIPPCNVKRRGEVVINNGCWVALEQRPPCEDDHAEYKGKCYLPVARKDRPPQSVQP
ncbi:hypothetical protein [Cystobacter ferrugineus]|uniref:Protein kinase n=1 Tax=Cystobacter ferrugineus TaxID=83449 RepID=A0A1L9B138_9BACT|nr:hypothetical protein [Cystobacter ferrugineus]OJH35974.1 hypothetical protein BON30_35830 [Cystobacter ferrugineus]